jgi:predicted nucleic acid-binding protein
VTRSNYIDTNVIIAFINNRDSNHARALKIFNYRNRKVTSMIAVLELKSVLSRTTKLSFDEIEAFVDYLPEINVEVPEVDENKIIRNAINIALRIRMKTLDLLHISASIIIGADAFITFDREFIEKEKEIANIGLIIKSE